MTAQSPLWTPSPEAVANAAITRFRKTAEERTGHAFATHEDLHAWSVDEPGAFWDLIWDHCGVIGEKGARVLVDGDRMPGAGFFPDARLNFAENLLRRTDDREVILFRGEDKVEIRLTGAELAGLVSRLQQALRAAGVGNGDRVAAMMPNMPETIAFMLATASLGAIWSSCSPDFGEQGVLDRFGQIEPTVFVACDGYWYNGKQIDCADKIVALEAKLPTARKLVIVPYLGHADDVAGRLQRGATLDAFMAPFAVEPLTFERVPFAHPLYILFSSGTTGIPKCIVHAAGGVLLQHLKEHKLHCDLSPGDRLFYFTTCGWMMWNWLVSGLAAEATLLLYDGSPFAPDGSVLFDYAQKERMTFFGTSAKYIDAVRKSGLTPKASHDLSSVRTMASTGSPLAPESFDFVYADIKPDIHLASVSGGTDIVSCFVIGNPAKPVYKGEIQGPGLGMAVDVFDEDGRPIRGEKGELVCTRPFPSMPVMFWNDPDGRKYRNAYFDRFDNIWCHGDFAEWTAQGGMIIHGRSDATLNPGGVRIGTAEIYNQVEQMPEVVEALCIGQDWDSDVRVVLFARLADGVALDEGLMQAIKAKIRNGCTPRHVPAKIVAVTDIPRTKSGKIVELAVRDVVHGRAVKNKEALANPEALDLFRDLDVLQT
ncbi:MAG: acetoacetate--CoA ligase [Pseudomonadota bacterium]